MLAIAYVDKEKMGETERYEDTLERVDLSIEG